MKKFKRIIAIILVLAIVFCTLISPISYAFSITLVSLASAAVVASILTACGVVMTQPETFTSLCNSICDVAKFSAKIPIKIMAGVGYVATDVIDKVITTANSLKAFNPVADKPTKIGNISLSGFVIGDMLWEVQSSCILLSSFDSLDKMFPNGNNSELYVKVNSTFSYYFKLRAPDIYFGYAVPDSFGGYSYSRLSSMASRTFFEKGYFNIWSPFCDMKTKCISSILFSCKSPPVGHLWDNIGGSFQRDYPFSDIGSISAEFPWDVTKDLPGIDETGAGNPSITYPAVSEPWRAGAVPIDGTPSLPLSIPSTVPAEIGVQTQPNAQTGEIPDKVLNPSDTKPGTGDLAIPDAKVIDDTLKDLSLPISIADYFPFCIPFDLVKGIKLLVSPPADPVFDIPIQLPYIGEQHLKIDLRQFGGLAVICRWFLMVMFIVSLALLTSKVIKW